MSEQHDIIVGIDLGTTFSLVAYVDERGPQIIRDERGEGRVPSVLGFSPTDQAAGTITIGWQARNHAIENPRATVYSIKRLIGKSLEQIHDELPFLAYAVQQGPRETLQIEIDGRRYSPEEISSLLLRELKARAEAHLGQPVRKAVITVPAYFDDAQRQATRDAGAAAGLEVVRIINEPTAAALAYGLGLRTMPQAAAGREIRRSEQGRVSLPLPSCHDAAGAPQSAGAEAIENRKSKIENDQIVAVYDLGGGTFDISILRIEDGVFQVLATAGDTHLGGDDFDRRIIKLVQDEVRQQFSLSIDSPRTRQALRTLAENVKVKLTEAPSAALELDLGQGRVYQRTITRDEFDRITADLVGRTIDLIRRAIRDAKLQPSDIAEIILVGGSTRMPVVRTKVAEFFERTPYAALNPDEVVALGAAIQGAILGGGSSLASQSAEGGRSPSAALLDMLLLDVTPLSLGIETMGGAMGKLILRNTTIPCSATEMFTTFVDGQTSIKINVLQGERELARDCRSLGEFTLSGLPPMPAGIPKVEVEFLIDANGILNVAARELRSGQKASIQIVPNRGLTRDEAEQMARAAIEHGREDIAAHRRIDLMNQVEFDTAKTEQMLARVGDQLDAGERRRIESDLAGLRRLARESTDLEQLHAALDAFGRSTLHLAEIGIREALKTQ